MNRRKVMPTLLAVVLLICGTCLATPQAGDWLTYKGKAYNVHGHSIGVYFEEHGTEAPAVLRQWISTACWCGHIVSWEVRDNDRLFLSRITAGDGKTDIPVSAVFTNETGPFEATWYSGKMESPRVRLRYFHCGVGGDYAYWRTFSFRNGRLVGTGFYLTRFFVLWRLVPLAVLNVIGVASIILTRRKRKLTAG
jgi:hypothetical protein